MVIGLGRVIRRGVGTPTGARKECVLSWLMVSAVVVGCVVPVIPVVRRYLLRRRAVVRTRTALGWFYQQRRRRPRERGYGRHALRAPDRQLST